jgi:hypothetical protein
MATRSAAGCPAAPAGPRQCQALPRLRPWLPVPPAGVLLPPAAPQPGLAWTRAAATAAHTAVVSDGQQRLHDQGDAPGRLPWRGGHQQTLWQHRVNMCRAASVVAAQHLQDTLKAPLHHAHFHCAAPAIPAAAVHIAMHPIACMDRHAWWHVHYGLQRP